MGARALQPASNAARTPSAPLYNTDDTKGARRQRQLDTAPKSGALSQHGGGTLKKALRRRCVVFTGAISSIAALTGLPQTASMSMAQAYPTKPIRLIVPYAPGGGADILARAVGQKLSESFGQSVVPDNRAGGGGIVGADIVAKAAPDGYTLLFPSSAHTIVPSLYSKVPYDALKDFAPISQLTSQPYILGVHPSVSAKSAKELIALAKSKPGQLNYASGGSGTAPHLGGELLKNLAGIDLVHVPYKGGGPALLALMSGEVAMLFSSLPSTLPQMKAGKIRALAVSGKVRSSAAPELPTVAESGVPGFDVTNWYGVLAPANTPKAIIATLHAEIVRELNTPDLQARLASDGSDVVGSTPAAFAGDLKAEIVKWAKVVKISGAHAD